MDTATAAQQEITAITLDHERQITSLRLDLHRLHLAQAAQRIQTEFPQVAYFSLNRAESDDTDFTVTDSMDADSNPLHEDVDYDLRTTVFEGYDADDLQSVLGHVHSVAEAAAYRPDRTPELSLEDLGDQKGKVRFGFTIRETTNYTGHFTADRQALAQWMREKGLTDLSGDDLQEFTSDRGIDHEEKHGDVQGQEWSDLTVD